MSHVTPNRAPTVVGVREAFSDTFGPYLPADWTLDAECTRGDPRDFYPDHGGASRRGNRALKFCQSCIVRETCLEDALAYEMGVIVTGQQLEPYGIRGGLTARQRKAIANQRSIEAREAARVAVLEDYRNGQTSVKALAAKHSTPYQTIRDWLITEGLLVTKNLRSVS